MLSSSSRSAAKKDAWPAQRATSRPSERTVASTAGETVQRSSSHSPPLRGGMPSMGSASTSSDVEACGRWLFLLLLSRRRRRSGFGEAAPAGHRGDAPAAQIDAAAAPGTAWARAIIFRRAREEKPANSVREFSEKKRFVSSCPSSTFFNFATLPLPSLPPSLPSESKTSVSFLSCRYL